MIEGADRRLGEAVVEALDSLRGEREPREDDGREHKRVPRREAEEEQGYHRCRPNDDDRNRVEADDRFLQPPEREQRERVGLRGDVDQAVVRERSRKSRCEDGRRSGCAGRAGHATLDPGKQRDQKERGNVKDVPLLDAR